MLIDQSYTIDTPLTNILLMKQTSSNLSNSINIGQNSFNLPSFCQMLNKINCNETKILIQVFFILFKRRCL
jgi:hypothetical protein